MILATAAGTARVENLFSGDGEETVDPDRAVAYVALLLDGPDAGRGAAGLLDHAQALTVH